MSNQPGNGGDERRNQGNEQPQGQGGQPRGQGGQPRGQGGQPRGQGGQPQGQGGQPQGRPQQRGGRAPPRQSAGGVGDIFNREDTKSQIIQGVVLFAAVGVGLGLLIILGDALADQRVARWSSGPLLASIVAVLVAQSHTEALADVEDSLAYATTAAAAAAGTLVLSLLTWLSEEIIAEDSSTTDTGFGEVEVSNPLAPPDIGDAFLVWIVAAIAVAAIAVLVVFADRNL